ncbi:GntR family transcriptional regulator [Reticulibacter mediterranei]|uniref:GntR family transcriptional regulator n=1 Tax=Reticulibacter mediterranei TaxID=2778369 RepID=A0A8J3IUA1_9CHLR|nr:PLP-dependent aminotransferase family protein [Reticulibacter mediterranei]GHP00977.1 GntR family transcriptional regulator [Reticulibacter mediterranei]
MVKRAKPGKRPEIILNQNDSIPLYRQLYERLRAEILAGQLEAGARLPSTRILASTLGVSRNTTALAYELLLLEGYIESRVGDGTRVAHLEYGRSFHTTRKKYVTKDVEPQQTQLSRRGELLVTASSASEPVNRTSTDLFRVGQPDVAYFPYETWARLVARHARRSLQAVSLYQDAQGYAPLREAIAAHIGITRGVHCSPEQIIITAGSQGALDLVARVLLDPGDAAWVEEPGYQGARGSLLAAGAELVPVPVDGEGIDVALGQQLRQDARLAVVTPSHQFPSGVTMSLQRRMALLAWAREVDGWIIEDDYDSEYRFSGRPLEALYGLDSARRVLYVGTFSKVLFPSLRLGYLVAPPELLNGLLAARRFIDVYLPPLEQMVLADFIAEGHFIRHLRKMRQIYLERRNALIDALRHELADLLDVVVPEAGMHLVVWLPANVNVQAVAGLISKHGLDISFVSQFGRRPLTREGLLLGFAGTPPEELRAGVHKLALALHE